MVSCLRWDSDNTSRPPVALMTSPSIGEPFFSATRLNLPSVALGVRAAADTEATAPARRVRAVSYMVVVLRGRELVRCLRVIWRDDC